MATPAGPVELAPLLMGLGGGLALFLFGMRLMTDALKVAAGESMKALIARLSANRFSATLAGALVTAVFQSSSVTTVLVVGFVSSGLLNLSQSVGYIIGANVGSTVTAQIIAFKVTDYALFMIAAGFFVEVLSRREKSRQLGKALMGLGLVFFGMVLMSDATHPLRAWPPFLDAMQGLASPLLGILAGFVFTAIVQSSAATASIVIVMAGQGLITLESGIAVVFGANIGTCVTALLSALGKPREAMRVTLAHILFNVGGVVAWYAFIPDLAELVRALSSDSLARQVANAHTLFNVANSLVALVFIGALAKAIRRVLPETEQERSGEVPWYLDEYFLQQPAMALDQVELELTRLAGCAGDMVRASLRVVVRGDRASVRALRQLDDRVDRLHGALVEYLGKLSLEDLVESDMTRLQRALLVAGVLENVGDVVSESLANAAEKRLEEGIRVSEDAERLLGALHAGVVAAYECVERALAEGDIDAARDAAASKKRVASLGEEARAYLVQRLESYGGERMGVFQLENDLIEDLKRVNTLTRRAGRALLEDEVR